MKKVLALIIIFNFQFSIFNFLHAQRDWQLTEQRNAWLTMNNAAALVTFDENNISMGTLSYTYEGGRYRCLSMGQDEMTLNADVRSYYRLSKNVMAYGSVTYNNFSGTNMSGSMLCSKVSTHITPSLIGRGGESLMPFDIIQPAEDAGRKHMELFNVVGGFGWNVYKGLSLGAKADFSAGNYSKYKDLRHANTLMNLNTMASVHYSFGSESSKFQSSKFQVGASFLYGRSTETIKYKTYGTTDHVYQVLLDYANHKGETLTYSSTSEGFVSGTDELPLFDEQCGFSMQGALSSQLSALNLILEFTYLHRNGYYGKQSQYDASYEQHDGNLYGWHVRVNLPSSLNSKPSSLVHWIDFKLNSEGLTSYKNNYRQVKSATNSSVTYYDYSEPTKMADKVLNSGSVAYTAYFGTWNRKPETRNLKPETRNLKPETRNLKPETLYKWNLELGTLFLLSKQTAYLFPDMSTRKASLWTPYIRCKRNLLFQNTGVLGMEIAVSAQCGDMNIEMDGVGRQLAQALTASYEFPFRGVRPNIALHYSCAEANDALYSGTYRHNVSLSLGVMF